MNERTPRQAFKAAFLVKCAEEGLTLEETHEVAEQALQQVKSSGALGDILKALGKPLTAATGMARDAVGAVAKPMANMGMTAALVGPPALGAAAGYGLSKMTDLDDTDVEEIRNQELIEEYRRQADRLRTRRKER